MSKITNRDTARRNGGSIDERLARLLDTPLLARVVPHLSPETLHQLIRYRGLEACGELVASATPAQLTSLLDLDLWHHARPGHDHLFDIDRFGEWLEALVNTGDSAAARTLAGLDPNVVVAGLSRYVRVFDPGIFEPTAQSDDESADRFEAMREGGGDWLECEVGGYIVRARRADAWDAIITLLIALDSEHNSCFHDVMQRCRRLGNSRPEIDGLDDLLLAPEQQLHDVTLERERRRSQQGYATPADARAFLEMARRPKREGGSSITGSIKANPIVTAYFRAAGEAPASSNETASPDRRRLESASAASHAGDLAAHTTGGSESVEAIMELLTEAGMVPERPRALLETADTDPHVARPGSQPRRHGAVGSRLTSLRRLMACARDTDETIYFTRGRELGFLANVLLAGCSVQSRPFTPQEASDAAASICNLGLEHWASADTLPSDSLLLDHDLVAAFEVGWSVLHQEVSLFAADQLISMLADLHCVDRDIRLGLVALRRTLVAHRDAGTPWRARDAAEILAMLDTAAWIGVLGLLDECPVLPAALTAVIEGRTTTVSPTAFEFISTADQISDVRTFMRKLPDLLWH
jgi:hypothetical protein